MVNVGQLYVRLVLVNGKTLCALGRAAELLDELQEDFPWRDEPEQAANAIREAIEGLRPEVQLQSNDR